MIHAACIFALLCEGVGRCKNKQSDKKYKSIHGFYFKGRVQMTQMENLTISKASRDDLTKLLAIAEGMGSGKSHDYFDVAMEQQDSGVRQIFIVYLNGAYAGYCMLVWAPKYAFYRKMDIPEIQDLNVLRRFRRRGIARFMIAHCEALARDAGKEYIGIGVGMDRSYGAAQRLYVGLGYVPDGNGLTYDRQVIAKGEFRPVDDDMSLMMIKIF